jgi:hypothetical protein
MFLFTEKFIKYQFKQQWKTFTFISFLKIKTLKEKKTGFVCAVVEEKASSLSYSNQNF